MIEFYNLTFRELKSKPVKEFDDPYHIACSLSSSMKNAILNNPSGYRDDEICQILAVDNNCVIGCINPYSGRIVVNNVIVPVQQGSYLFAHEDYRKENVGADLFLRIATLHSSQNALFAGISHMAIGLYHALKFTVFEFPRFIYLRKSRCVLQALLKTNSFIINPIIWLADAILFLHRVVLKSLFLQTKRYKIELCDNIPDEVIQIVNEDNHPYKECHDKAWFEWNLNYSLTDEPRLKRLYVIKENYKIVGFFLTKQQFFKTASNRGFRNVYLGSVMEWGIARNSSLTEKEIYLMSLNYFDSTIDGIQFATSDISLAKSLKKFLFVPIGNANLSFKLRTVKDPAVKDIKNWRIRIATSDTLMN